MAALLIDLALATALIVIVPMAMRLRNELDHPRLVILAGAAAASSAFVPHRYAATALALPWLALCAFRALRALVDLSVRTLLHHVPTAYLAVGAAWLVMSRFELRPLALPDVIVELTGVHFHFAGFVAPVIVACLRERVRGRRRAYEVASAALLLVLIATPLTAAGIAIADAAGIIGALCFTAGLWTAALLTLLRVVPRVERGPKVALGLSSLSVIVPMVLAVLYALGEWRGDVIVSIETMVRIHGVLNAFGFALMGVIGWTRLEPR